MTTPCTKTFKDNTQHLQSSLCRFDIQRIHSTVLYHLHFKL